MKILASAKSLPSKVVTNDDLSKIVDTSHEWIVQRTGIEERRISEKNTSDLAYEAASLAIEKAGIDKNSIDLIICATATPDNKFPSVACLVQEKLGLPDSVTAFDLNAACTGFIYGLKVASAMLSTYHKRALVIGAEVLSKIIDYSDRNTCVLFGDGAGAVVLEADGKNTEFFTKSLGQEENLYAKASDLNLELDKTSVEEGFLKMNGSEVFKFAVAAMEEAVRGVLAQNELDLDNVKLIIPHQANKRIIDFVAKKLKQDKEKFYINLNKYGNTSAASIAIALDEALEEKKLVSGDKVLLVGFGAGLTWGATILEI
ncbi:MAG: beta-ketoacyl-ACP synthase III [Gemella sp.]|nr:beta-ketoacyl-ACP synthase III [Gemella sp.]